MSELLPRALVADDDLTVRLLLQAALENNGFAVSLAEDGLAAMTAFLATPCDIVLLDVEMPGLTGHQVCAQIRRDWNDIPIVLVTGHDDVASIELAFQMGATDFIAKPINWTLIAHRLRYIMRACRTQQSLHLAEARNRAILHALPDLLLRVDQHGRILERHGEAAMQTLFLGGSDASAAQLPGHAAEYLPGILRACHSGQVQNIENETADSQGKKHYFDGRIAAMGPEEALCLIRDVTERRESELKIHRLAYFDTLTGLPNRQSFSLLTERELARSHRQGSPLALLFMDLDGFKGINDSLGHHVGDRILQWTADRLRADLRALDVLGRQSGAPSGDSDEELGIARMGGDEFIILLWGIAQPEHALLVANRIRKLISRSVIVDDQELIITASIGIALYPEDADDAATLLKHSETAMYAAKAKGRDNCQFYSSSLTDSAVRRLNLESSLRLALEHNEFQLVYQPQIDVASGSIFSVEALIRWQHPDKGLISPLEFIPLAEELGLILPIGEWVLRTACTDSMRWRAAGLPPIRMAVNLSPIQFRDPGLQKVILEILGATGLPAESLELEITESTVMEDAGRTLGVLHALRAQGIHIALDDFGTGFSSLSHLKLLPLSRLKIDRTFVRDLPDSREDEAIVRAVVTLANNLGMRVTAEGAETAEQCRLLGDLGCNTIQGFHFSRPVPYDALAELLRRPAYPVLP